MIKFFIVVKKFVRRICEERKWNFISLLFSNKRDIRMMIRFREVRFSCALSISFVDINLILTNYIYDLRYYIYSLYYNHKRSLTSAIHSKNFGRWWTEGDKLADKFAYYCCCCCCVTTQENPVVISSFRSFEANYLDRLDGRVGGPIDLGETFPAKAN